MNEDFPDSNGNGIPDAFENRRPISEILADESLETVMPIVRVVTSNSILYRLPVAQPERDIDVERAEYKRLEQKVRDAIAELEAFKAKLR